jgi:uncharacterized protein
VNAITGLGGNQFLAGCQALFPDTPQLEEELKLSRLERLAAGVQKLYKADDPAHDWLHVQRVIANCKRLAEAEGADLEILTAAALLHDIVNLPKNHPQRRQASALAARAAREYLRQDFSESETERICTAIEEHSYSLGKTPSTLESALLQDADRLDAIGAIGVMRTIACGAQMGSPFYETSEPFSTTRTLEDRYMVDHFYLKTLKLGEGMNSQTARELAARRVEFIEKFLGQLNAELSGEG